MEYIAIVIGGLLIVTVLYIIAPWGYQTKSGFHYGTPPKYEESSD